MTRLALARATLAAFAAAFAVALPSGAADHGLSKVRKTCSDYLAHELDVNHVDRRAIDLGAECEELAKKARMGLPSSQMNRWLAQKLSDLLVGFAPEGAIHDASARYRLPYEVWIPRLVAQGPNGRTHNTPEDRFAYDFLMPIGTPVLAARGGRVGAVRDGSHARAVADPKGDRGNSVWILHADGTFGVYAHLEPGIPVERGQRIRAGQRIGLSGNTGFSHAPHLHFVVRQRMRSGGVLAVPIRFGAPGRKDLMLKPGQYYGRAPQTRRTLRVHVGDQLVDPGVPVSIRKGSSVSIRVEQIDADGSSTEITDAERVRYESMTIWSLDVTKEGRIVARESRGWAKGYIEKRLPWLNRSEGLVYIYHGLPRDPDFGFAEIRVALTP